MEWEHRHLDGKSDKERPENPALRRGCQVQIIEIDNGRRVRNGRLVIQINQGNEHEQTAEDGVNEELKRNRNPIGSAPHGRQKIDRNQCGLKKEIEQKRIAGGENPHQCGLHKQNQRIERGRTLIVLPKRRQNYERNEQARE